MAADPGGPAGRNLNQIAVDLAVRLFFLGLLFYFVMRLVEPFASVLLWSIVLAVAFHPLYARLRDRLGGRGWLAATLLTGACLLTVLGPVTLLLSSLVVSLERLGRRLLGGELHLPPPPAALGHLPILGDVSATWTLASSNVEGFLTRYGRTLLGAGEWLLRTVEGLAGSVVAILVGVIVAGFLYGPGPQLQLRLRHFAERVSGQHGSSFVDLAGATIRNVARGVIGVAMIQSMLIGAGLIVAEVPGAGLLALVTLVLCIVQIGALPVVVPLIVWAWMTMGTLPALVFSAWMIPSALSDNVLKPILMGKGLTTPMGIILLGVIGGSLTYGLLGLFFGPVVLAVFYDLLIFWTSEAEPRTGGIE